MGFVFMANATAIKDGAVPIVKSSNPCALTSVLVMVLIFKSLEAAHVIPTGPGQTALLVRMENYIYVMWYSNVLILYFPLSCSSKTNATH